MVVKFKNNKNRNNFLKRNRLSIFIVIFFMSIILLRLIQIQIFNRSKYLSLMDNQVSSTEEEVGERGIIYDVNGKKIAFNKRIYTMFVNPDLLNDEKYATRIFKDIELIQENNLLKFEKNIIENLKKLALKHKKYKVIAKNIEDEKKKKIQEVLNNYYQKQYIGNKKKNKKFYKSLLTFKKNNERIYYKENDYSKLIGMVKFYENSTSKIGISGLEKQYENYLIEHKRRISKLYGLNKKTILPLSKDKVFLDINGKNIHLTIDSDINYILNDEMKRQFKETQAKEAYGIIMDPNTGRILGLSTLSRDNKVLRNNTFQSQYEPGSIFKPLIVAAALNEGLISKHSKFNVGDGSILKYKKVIKESNRNTRGNLETKDVVKKSSNVGMVLISDYFSDKLFEEYLKKYGLYDKTNIDFPNELRPYAISYKKWDRLKKNTMAFGQGVAVTPIQMATAFSAVVNGGKLYKPYLVDKITDNEGIVIRRNSPEKIRDVISESVSKTMREFLEETVNDGTGKRARIEGYSVGGKTGTAQLSAGKSGYEKNQYLASFVGILPADKPKYLALVMFMRPQADVSYKKFGGYVSAPVVGNIFKRIIKNDKIFSKNISKINYATKKLTFHNIDSLNTDLNLQVMPNLKGLSPREVIEVFKNENIQIEIEGKGIVEEQIPEENESLKNISKIKIILK